MLIKHTTRPAYEDDLLRVKNALRALLGKLEQALAEENPDSADKETLLQKTHDRLFGAKASLTSTLVTLAELMMKLEESGGHALRDVEDTPMRLNESDQLLIDDFVRRQRQSAMPDVTRGALL